MDAQLKTFFISQGWVAVVEERGAGHLASTCLTIDADDLSTLTSKAKAIAFGKRLANDYLDRWEQRNADRMREFTREAPLVLEPKT